MQTIIKSVNGYQVVPVDALLNAHRAIYISGEINDELAMNVVKQVTYLAHEDSTEPIRMYINSCGGAIDAGMVIYDILQACPAPEPLISTGVGGKTSSIQTIAESMMKTKEEMVAILAKHTGQPLEKLYEVTKTDTFFSADEAVDFGLADKVVDFAEMVK